MPPRDSPVSRPSDSSVCLDQIVETAPVAILVQDISAVVASLTALRDQGIVDLADYLEAHPEFLRDLPGKVRGVMANGRARWLLRVEPDVDTTGLLRGFLERPANAAMVRDSLLALWRGEECHESEGVGETADGWPLPLLINIVLPHGLEDARASVIYLFDRSDAAYREAALQASEERFRLVFDRASHGMALLDMEGRCQRANAALGEILGYTESELRALDLQDVTLRAEDWRAARDWLAGIVHDPTLGFSREICLARKDGGNVWVLVTASLLPGVAEDPPLIVAHVQDINQRKQAEDALASSEARFRQSFEHAGHGMALVSPEGRILTANRAFCDTVGLSTEVLANLAMDDLTLEADRQEERRLREYVIATGTAAFAMEKRMFHARAGLLWVRVTAALVRDVAGQPLYFVYQTVNVTDHHEALARAQAAESLLLGAVETVDEDVLLFDSTERLMLANSHFRAAAPELADVLKPGTSLATILKRIADLELVFPGDGKTIAEWVMWRLGYFRSRNPEPFELQMWDGRWFLVRQGRADDGSILILRSDITDIKRREAALTEAKHEADRANRAKSAFLANMSHELRTPLNAINGFSEVLLRELYGPLGAAPYKDYVRNILDSGRHLLALINDVLDLSRIEAGHLSLEVSEEDPADLVKQSMRCYIGDAHAKGIHLSSEVRPMPVRVWVDPKRIRQILDNLLSNSIKYTPEGGSVVVHGRQASSGQLVLAVSDTGIGMSADDIAVAVANFGQVESVFARAEGGTGLGLPLARALTEAHGGTLEIISHPGEGTTVSVRLPSWRVIQREDDTTGPPVPPVPPVPPAPDAEPQGGGHGDHGQG